MFTISFENAVRLIKGAVYPEDIFIQDKTEPKMVYRKLRMVVHEDRVGEDKKLEAKKLFQDLTEIWEFAESLINSNEFGKKLKTLKDLTKTKTVSKIDFFVKSKKSTYSKLELYQEGNVANTYFGFDFSGKKVVVKIATSPECNIFLEAESGNIKKMLEKFPRHEHGRYFPEIIDSFFVDISGKRLTVNVFSFLDNYICLEDILNGFKKSNKNIETKHIVWMYNRLLESTSCSGPCNIVHGGIHPKNILVHPESHRIVLTGWTSSVDVNDKISYVDSDYLNLYPQEVVGDKDKRKAVLSTDLYMAASTITYLMNGNIAKAEFPKSIPREIQSFLKARLTSNYLLRDSVAIQQRDRFSDVLKLVYGPPKFHQFVVPV